MIEHISCTLVLGCLMLHVMEYLTIFTYASLFLNSLYAVLSMKDTCRTSTLHRLLTGEVFSLLLYLGFLLINRESTFLYYMPVIISCTGKLYLMLHHRTNTDMELVE